MLEVKIILTYFFTFVASKQYNNSNECNLWSKTHVLNQTERHYFNMTAVFIKFRKFSDLEIICKNVKYNLEFLKLYAEEEVLLDNKLDLKNLLSHFKYVKTIYFQNIKGFNQNSVGKTTNEFISTFNLNFYNIKFEFYSNEKLITDADCKRKAFNFSLSGFFGSIKNLILTDNVFYNNKVCPYVFADTNLEQLGLFGITDSLIFKNRLEFTYINETDFFYLGTTNLVFLKLNVAYSKINLKILNQHVFKNIENLFLSGILDEIESGLFAHFRKLNAIVINHDSFANFFHSGLNWTNSLNMDINIDVTRSNEFLKIR